MDREAPTPGKLRPRDPVFGIAAALAALLFVALGSAAHAQPPVAVPTRPDPFERLATLDAGRVASTWSSLPAGDGCRQDERSLAGHGLLLVEPAGDEQRAVPGPFSLLQPRQRLQLDATAQLGCVFGQVALQRQLAPGGDRWTWDGSAIGWRIDRHWRVGAGRIARHWGPGWDGSLILGTDARTVPGLALDAQSGPLGDSRWWGWLGEAQFSGFLGQLESDRGDVSRPWLMGMRVVLRPWQWLELGLSRTMQLGGEGRDNSLRAFLKAFLARDNSCYQAGCSEQPGNQLGGYDLRVGLDRWLPGVALYGQLIGEDNRPDDLPLPAKNMRLAGVDWRRDGALAFVEWTDSLAQYAGVAYNHFIFSDGYRHAGRPLGHWADGDSTLWTVGGLLPGLFGGQALAVLRYGTLNEASANPSWPNSRLAGASLQWRTVLDRAFGLTLALDHVELASLRHGEAGWRDTQLRLQFDAWLH